MYYPNNETSVRCNQTCAWFQLAGIDSDSASEQAESIQIPIPSVTGKVELIPIPIPALYSPSGVDSDSGSRGQKKSMILIPESIPFITFCNIFFFNGLH